MNPNILTILGKTISAVASFVKHCNGRSSESLIGNHKQSKGQCVKTKNSRNRARAYSPLEPSFMRVAT
jgi:hypothetical protein